ncbi:hypothetical protein B0H94_103185 [Salsuginibacillus halophilus]|uniref:Uncharacterized protein n=1 Tax=Salsuginibacillus halophilus TaxID=517424 RepID=A0A2P8HWG7_9BACI|nr:hypothetical protein [Salsuginibacillus halophilus]PSL50573.1 hypothetical protein B0H94_103185 [Salsuginibacillus halophilus]
MQNNNINAKQRMKIWGSRLLIGYGGVLATLLLMFILTAMVSFTGEAAQTILDSDAPSGVADQFGEYAEMFWTWFLRLFPVPAGF